VTSSEEVALSVRELRDHGGTHRYQHRCVGYTSRPDTIQAGVLSTKLAHLLEWNEERQRIASHYLGLLSEESGVVVPSVSKETRVTFFIFT